MSRRQALKKEIAQIEKQMGETVSTLETQAYDLSVKIKHQLLLAFMLGGATLLISAINQSLRPKPTVKKKRGQVKHWLIRVGAFVLPRLL